MSNLDQIVIPSEFKSQLEKCDKKFRGCHQHDAHVIIQIKTGTVPFSAGYIS